MVNIHNSNKEENNSNKEENPTKKALVRQIEDLESARKECLERKDYVNMVNISGEIRKTIEKLEETTGLIF